MPRTSHSSGDYIGIDTANNAPGQDTNLNTIYEGNGTYGVTIQSENGGAATGNLLTNDIVSANDYNGIILSGLDTSKNVISGTSIGSDNTGADVVDDPGNLLGNGQHGGGGSGIVINGGANPITPSAERRPPPETSSWATRATASTSPTPARTTTSSRAMSSVPTSPVCTGRMASSARSYGNGLGGVAIVIGGGGQRRQRNPDGPRGHLGQRRRRRPDLRQRPTINIVGASTSAPTSTGETALPNAGDGVAVNNEASENFIGLGGQPQRHLGQHGQRREPHRLRRRIQQLSSRTT